MAEAERKSTEEYSEERKGDEGSIRNGETAKQDRDKEKWKVPREKRARRTMCRKHKRNKKRKPQQAVEEGLE